MRNATRNSQVMYMISRIHGYEKLNLVHQDLRHVVEKAIEYLPEGMELQVVEGVRTLERQKKMVAMGASRTMNSRHLTGHAVDLAPLVDFDGDGDLDLRWDWPLFYKISAAMKSAAKQLNTPLEWGGSWFRFKDGPHFQLPWKQYPLKEK